MKLICPKCGSGFSLEEIFREGAWREIADLAAKYAGSWTAVYEYTDCFRQSEFGTISLTRRFRLLKEVYGLFESQKFRYQGKRYRTNRQEISKAMGQICNANKWGFRNHNYLVVILKKTAERLSVEGLTAREEAEREEHRAEGIEHSEKEFLGRSPEKVRRKILGVLDNLGGEK